MRWYQKLFWRIFGAVWLVSMLGILVSLGLYLALSDSTEHREDQLERAEYFAEQVISAYERFEEPRLRRRHQLPIWVYDPKGNQIYGGPRRPPPNSRSLVVEGKGNTAYRVLVNLPQDRFAVERLLGFVLSMQAIWVLAVSFISSLLLAWLVVRPINALRKHVRTLYDDQNLSHRAEGRLSQRSDELGELAREFNRMADYVEQTLGTQENLLRDVSHELRAPLARLRAATGLAEQRWGEDQKVLQRIAKECDQLESLITELLALSREGKVKSSEQLDLAELIGQLVDDARLIGGLHPIVLKLDIEKGSVKISQEPLSRIVSNLLVNAISHTPDNTRIDVEATLNDQMLKLIVSDDGPGVDPKLLRELGQPFKRSIDSKGYGLGLSISCKAAEHAGGVINFDNRAAGGFVARVELPLL